MESSPARLATLLEQTLSTQQETVQAATAELQVEEKKPGFAKNLLGTCRNEYCGVAATTCLKNFVKSKWSQEVIPDSEKNEIRSKLVENLLCVDGPRLRLLAETFRLVAKHDFLEKRWPELLPGLKASIQQSNLINGMHCSPIKTYNAFVAVDAVVKHFQYFRDASVAKEEAPEELEVIATELLTPMHNIFHLLTIQIASGATAEEVLTEQSNVLLIMTKITFHATKSYMPKALEPSMKMWVSHMVMLLGLVRFDVLYETKHYQARLKAWKRMLQFLSNMVTRHRKLADKHLQQMCEAALKIINAAAGCTEPLLAPQERIVGLAYGLLATILETGPGWRMLVPHFQELINKAIIPSLWLRKEDMEMWEEDYEEYLGRNLPSDLDVSGGWKVDLYTIRRSALNLLALIAVAKGPPTAASVSKSAPVQKRKKGGKTGGKVEDGKVMAGEALVLPALQQFSLPPDGAQPDADEVAKYYGVLLAYGTLQEFFMKRSELVEPMLKMRVHPVFAMISPSPFVVANACWLLGELAPCLSEDIMEDTFKVMHKYLGAKDLGIFSWRPVRASAAGAIAKLLEEVDENIVPWGELLQAAVAGAASEDGDEATTMLKLLGAIADTESQKLANHMPAVFASVAESVARHIPAPSQEWPPAAESGFQTMNSLYVLWSQYVDEEENDVPVVQDSETGNKTIALAMVKVLQRAWLGVGAQRRNSNDWTLMDGAEDSEKDPDEDEDEHGDEAGADCLGEASVMVDHVCRQVKDAETLGAWRVGDLLQAWAVAVSDWPAWQQEEERCVFDAIEGVLDLHKRVPIPNFEEAKAVASAMSDASPSLSIMSGMASFLQLAIEHGSSANVREACRLTHEVLHSCAMSFGSSAGTAALESLAHALLLRLAAGPNASTSRAIILGLCSCFLLAPRTVFPTHSTTTTTTTIQQQVQPQPGQAPPESELEWGRSLASLVTSEDEEAGTSGFVLESQLKLAVLALVKLAEDMGGNFSSAPQAMDMARLAMMAAVEGLLQLKTLRETETMEEEDDDEGEEEEDSDIDSEGSEEEDNREETEEEFYKRYAEAAEGEQEVEEEDEEEEAEHAEVELGTFALQDELALGMAGLRNFRGLLVGFQDAEDVLSRFVGEYPDAKELLAH